MDIAIQSGLFMQRVRVPAGFIVRRKLIFTSYPLNVFLQWNGMTMQSGVVPFVPGSFGVSFFRIRIYNFPLNDADQSLWHFWGPLSFNIPASTGVGAIVIWQPTDNTKIWKIRRIDIQCLNIGSAATIFEVGFATPAYKTPLTSYTGQGVITVQTEIPATWPGFFTIYNREKESDGLLLTTQQNFSAYVQAAFAVTAAMMVNIQIDVFDPLVGINSGYPT